MLTLWILQGYRQNLEFFSALKLHQLDFWRLCRIGWESIDNGCIISWIDTEISTCECSNNILVIIVDYV